MLFGCKFPEMRQGSDDMTAIMLYTLQYGVDMLLDMCKKRYREANGKIGVGGGESTALQLVCANASRLLTTSTTEKATVMMDHASQVLMEINMTMLSDEGGY